MIFTSSFESGEVPEDWKTAVIVPIYKKKGLRSDLTNYRPVSLTSVPCKIMESLIRDNLLEFTESNNILTKHQHGFIQHRSCLTNLLEALEAWTEALDEGLGVDVLFLDYRKAFDSVAHKKLIDKLQILGIQEYRVHCALSCTVYCNRPCLCVCLCVSLFALLQPVFALPLNAFSYSLNMNVSVQLTTYAHSFCISSELFFHYVCSDDAMKR